MAIFKDRVEDEISIVSLCKIFLKVDKQATRVIFWFCTLAVDLDGGLYPIRVNDDVKLMNEAHWGMGTRIIYAYSGDDPFEKLLEHGGDNVVEPNSTKAASTSQNKCADINDGGVHNTKTFKRLQKRKKIGLVTPLQRKQIMLMIRILNG